MAQDNRKTLVACIGNMLLMDEGFGPYMARVLTEPDFAAQFFDKEHVQMLQETFRSDEVGATDDGRIPVLDGGTMGMSLLPWVREYDHIVVIDIIDTKNPKIAPGSVFVLTPQEMAENTVLHSLHDLRLIDVIGNCALAGYTADWTCICVQAKDYEPADFCVDITPELKEAIPRVMGALMQSIGKLEE